MLPEFVACLSGAFFESLASHFWLSSFADCQCWSKDQLEIRATSRGNNIVFLREYLGRLGGDTKPISRSRQELFMPSFLVTCSLRYCSAKLYNSSTDDFVPAVTKKQLNDTRCHLNKNFLSVCGKCLCSILYSWVWLSSRESIVYNQRYELPGCYVSWEVLALT